MHSSYNSLSGFLNNQIDNHNINEGLLADGIKKIFGFASGIEPSKEQTTKAKGLLGLFGALKASLSDDDDEITKAYKETMQKEQEQLDQQHREIQDKISKLEAEKIRAKSELKRNQRALKHKEQKDAYDARIAQVKAYATRAKNVKVILSANETDSMLRTIDAVGKELQIGADSPVKKMTELAMQICIGPDGKCRSLDEIKELAKTDNALAEHLKEYDSIAKEHGKVMVSSMKDQKAFSAAFDKFQKAADEERAAEAELEIANRKIEEYEENRKAVEAVNAARDEYNKAQEGVKTAQEAINNYKNPFVALSSDGKATANSDDDIKNGLKLPEDLSTDELNEFFKETEQDNNDGTITTVKSFNVDEYVSYLNDKGVPSEVTDKIKTNLDSQMTDTNPTSLKDVNDVIGKALGGKKSSDPNVGNEPGTEITSDDLKKISDNAAKKATADYSKLKATLSEAESRANSTPDPFDESKLADDPNDSEETRKKKEEMRQLKERYDSIPEEVQMPDGSTVDKDTAYDTTIEDGAGKKYEEHFTGLKEKAEAQQKTIVANRTARAEKRQSLLSSIEERRSLNLTPEETEQIESKASQLQAGESIKDGKIGYYAPDPENPGKTKFVERKENMTSEEENQYIKDRDTNTLFVDPKINSAANVKVKKEGDQWYRIDGEDKTEISSDEAIETLANRRMAEQSEATIIKKKQDFAATIKKVVGSDGKVNTAEYNKLTDEQKNQIKTVIKNPAMLDNAFKGIDLGGNNETLDDMKKHLSDVETSADDIDAIDKGRDDTDYNNSGNDTDWEDEKNDDEDNSGDDIETDEVEDVEDNDKTEDTDKDGNKLKKGSDGKWYKEDDLNDEGSPKDNVAAVDHKATKKQNKILKNPAKEWHRKKNKATGKTTKSYYNGEKDKSGNAISISAKEFRERVKNYQAAKAKYAKQPKKENTAQRPMNESIIDYTRLRDWLVEKLLNQIC